MNLIISVIVIFGILLIHIEAADLSIQKKALSTINNTGRGNDS